MRALRLREGGREGKTEDSANKGGGGATEGNRIPAGPGFPLMSEENWAGVEVWWIFPHLLSSVCPSLCFLWGSRKIGGWCRKTHCVVSLGTSRSVSPITPVRKPQGVLRMDHEFLGWIVSTLITSGGGTRGGHGDALSFVSPRKEKENEAQRKRGTCPRLSKGQRKSQRLETQGLPNAANTVSGLGPSLRDPIGI